MEVRKIIKFGKNSFVVSLPKAWIKKNNLEKGNHVYLKSASNQLLIGPENIHKKQEVKEAVIDADASDFETVKRKTISYYINDYSRIIFKFKKKKTGEKIRTEIQNLMALEIVEQSSSHIVAKDYINMDDIVIPSLIRKVDNIVRSMLKDLNEAIQGENIMNNSDLSDNINIRDQDVNRLTFLIMRAVKYSIKNPSSGVKLEEYGMLNSYEVCQYLERIADELKRITRALTNKKRRKIVNMKKLAIEFEKWYLQTMKAFYSRDTEAAYDAARQKNSILKHCDSFLDHNIKEPLAIKLVEKFKDMIGHTNSILRLTYQ